MRRPLRIALVVPVALFFFASVMAACSDDRPATSDTSGSPNQPGGAASCHAGRAGCPCDAPGAVADCGSIVRKDGDYVTCSQGQATCTGGTWGTCVGDHIVTASVNGVTLGGGGLTVAANTTTTCTDPCDPYCSQSISDPADIDAAGIAAGEGGVTLPGTVGGGGALCSGYQCDVDACGGNLDLTTIKGTVYDPAGNVPLYGALVYVPVDKDLTKLPAFPDSYATGITCDTCSGATLKAVSVGATDATGAFTLKGVPAGTNIPVIVQMGKWRRIVLLSTVTKCVDNTVANNCTAADKSLCQLRLPRNRFDGYNPAGGSYVSPTGKADMPRIAMVTGSADPFECMLLKAGIDPNEFGSLTKNPERRIHFYESPDAPGTSITSGYGNVVGGDTMWNDLATIKKYDGVILACEGDSIDKSTLGKTPYKNLIDYTNLGGRVFATHFSYVWLQYPKTQAGLTDWQNVATWVTPVCATGTTLCGDACMPTGKVCCNSVGRGGRYCPATKTCATTGKCSDGSSDIAGAAPSSNTNNTQDPMTATIVTAGFPKGQAFSDWLNNVSAANTPATSPAKINIHEGRQDLTTIGASTQAWMTSTNTKNSTNYTPSFTFNTPYAAAAASQCGRVVFSDFHVSAAALINTSDSSCQFNGDCGFTATCAGSVVARGTCSEPCATATDCNTGYACTGAVAGSCSQAVCNKNLSCSRGNCTSSTTTNGFCKCTRNSHCANNETCNTSTGICTSSTCTSASNCGPSQACTGAAQGECSKACTTSANCNGGEICVSGKCNGCDLASNCSTRNYPSKCVGGGTLGVCKNTDGTTNNNNNDFPQACQQGTLSPQEKALEFMFLDLTSCVSPDAAVPSFPKTLFTAATFTQDYVASCAPGSHARWREVDWQATIPATASIEIDAQSGPTASALKPSSPVAPAVAGVLVARPTVSTIVNGTDVAYIDTGSSGTGAFNTASPAVSSENILRLTITLNPTTDQSAPPVLKTWKVQYSCVPSE